MNQTLARKIFLTMLMFTALGCGPKQATTAVPQAESAPITNGGEQQSIILGQPVIQLEMNHNEMEPIFETREVPAVCTRVVQRGTQSQCHTEYQQVCSTHYEQQCRDVVFPVCVNHQENVCRNVPDQVCHTQTVPVCQTVQKCETVNDQVCRGTGAQRTCTNVPRRVCHVEQSCHNESRRVCETITRRECHIENRQQCHNETRRECTQVPRQQCQNVPNQVCVQVPIMVEENYPCTKPQQVQVGERLRLHQLAQIRVDLVNPRHLDVSRDELVLTLSNGRVSGVVRSASGIQYSLREVSRVVRRISQTEELIQVSLELTVLF